MHVKIRKRIGNPTLYNAKINYSLVMCPQVGSAEVGIYPPLVIGREFGHDVDFGLADVTHVLGCSPVMSLA